jgi:hypothetical protein
MLGLRDGGGEVEADERSIGSLCRGGRATAPGRREQGGGGVAPWTTREHGGQAQG